MPALNPLRYMHEPMHPMVLARAAILRDRPEVASAEDIETLAQSLLEIVNRYDELRAAVDAMLKYEEASHGGA